MVKNKGKKISFSFQHTSVLFQISTMSSDDESTKITANPNRNYNYNVADWIVEVVGMFMSVIIAFWIMIAIIMMDDDNSSEIKTPSNG